MKIKEFPKIFAIGARYTEGIFDGEVEITEKVDGSSFAFGLLNGELQMRSKGRCIYPESVDKLFYEAVHYVTSIQNGLVDNTVFYCEYLQKNKHNVLKYDRVPTNHLILFGVAHYTTEGNISFFTQEYETLSLWASSIGIEAVPCLYAGTLCGGTTISGSELITTLLDRQSVLGGTKIEGVVVKNYAKDVLCGDIVFPIMAGKYVSEAFKEVHRKASEGAPVRGHSWEAFCESFRTEARWQKAVQHLREDGLLLGEPKDIGGIIARVKQDIREEEINLFTSVWPELTDQLLRVAIRGIPEWWKEKILNGSTGLD